MKPIYLWEHPEDFENRPDDIPLTEQERNNSETLLRSLQRIDESPTRMVNMSDTDIEILQHGLLLLMSVMDHRIDFVENHMSNSNVIVRDEDITERQLNIRNFRQLYAHLEHAKNQLPI
jgi:hypothetical protein